jgi:histidinol phosphatase-like PHP family hydrolase
MKPTNRLSGDIPLVDLHAHLEGELSLPEAMQIAEKRGVTLGVVDHGGRGQVLDGDEALARYVGELEEYPVYKGMQAEGLDWTECFTPRALARLDYVLLDALTFPERDGRLVRLWTSGVQIDDAEDFMDRYVDFIVQVIATPIDIFANPTFLPACIADRYDALWTEVRMDRVVAAAVQHGAAIEINARYDLPSPAFIRRAKRAGVRFSFGSNYHGAEVGQIEYCVRMIEECDLTRKDLYLPGDDPRPRRARRR